MKDKVERDLVDEIIDGLPLKPGYEATEEYDDTPTRYSIPRWVVYTVPFFCFLIGAIVGLSALPEDSSRGRPSLPEPARTVTTTTTQAAIPASCARAIALMERVQEQVAIIGGAGEEQLDISHAARQAIFLKDWKALDKAMNKQTDLNNRLDKPATQAMTGTMELKKAMQECLDATK